MTLEPISGKRNKDSVGVLNYAIDKHAIVDSVLNAPGFVAYSPFQINSYGGNEEADYVTAMTLDKLAEERI